MLGERQEGGTNISLVGKEVLAWFGLIVSSWQNHPLTPPQQLNQRQRSKRGRWFALTALPTWGAWKRQPVIQDHPNTFSKDRENFF
jgi:hypothetical protein